MSDNQIPDNAEAADTDIHGIQDAYLKGMSEEEEEKSEEGKEEESAEESEEKEGEEASEEEEGGESEPEGVEIPGVGRLTPDQVRILQQQAQRASDLERQFADLQKEHESAKGYEKDLQELQQWRTLMGDNDVRQKVQSIIQEKIASGGFQQDGKGEAALAAFKDGRVDKIAEQMERMSGYFERIQQQEANQQIDSMFSTFREQYPKIVTKDFENLVIDKVIDSFKDRGDQLTAADVQGVAAQEILARVATASKEEGKQEILDELKGKGQGTRVVSGRGHRKSASPLPKDPSKMDWGDARAALEEAAFKESS